MLITSKHKRLLVIIFATMLVAGLLYTFFIPRETMPLEVREGDGRQTIATEGTYVCLPKKALAGMQTEECVAAIKTDEGRHYAVDFVPAPGSLFEPPQLGERISVEGYFTPAAALSASRWMEYEFEGIVSASR